jgi:hypothetical protein
VRATNARQRKAVRASQQHSEVRTSQPWEQRNWLLRGPAC